MYCIQAVWLSNRKLTGRCFIVEQFEVHMAWISRPTKEMTVDPHVFVVRIVLHLVEKTFLATNSTIELLVGAKVSKIHARIVRHTYSLSAAIGFP